MLSDPCKWLSDLQLGDEKVTLNHLGMIDLLVDPWEDMLNVWKVWSILPTFFLIQNYPNVDK